MAISLTCPKRHCDSHAWLAEAHNHGPLPIPGISNLLIQNIHPLSAVGDTIRGMPVPAYSNIPFAYDGRSLALIA